MKKNILIYGLIAGTIVSVLMLFTFNYISHCEGNVDYDTSMLVGYASILVACSLVFVGIRNYRDKYNGGVVSFGNAFIMGILIILIASTIYAIAWVIYSHYFAPDYAVKLSAQMLEKLKTDGTSQAEMAEQTRKMAEFVNDSKTILFNAKMAYLEVVPVGLIVTLISALILKKKEVK